MILSIDAAGCVFTSNFTSYFRLYTSYFCLGFHDQQIEAGRHIDTPCFALVVEFE